MELERYEILEKFSAYSVYIPTLLCLYKIKALNKSLWALLVYLILCICTDQISWSIDGSQKNFLFNGFTVLEYLLVVFIYYEHLALKKIKLGVIMLSIAFLFLSLFVFVIQRKYNSVDIIISSAESAILAIFGGYYLIILLIDPNILKLHKHYFYWINFGFLLYFSVAILLFLSNDYLKQCKPSTFYLVWGVHLILNTIKNVLFAVGVWMKRST